MKIQQRENVNKLIKDAQKVKEWIYKSSIWIRSVRHKLAYIIKLCVSAHGKAEADRFSARPGYSECSNRFSIRPYR